MKKKLMKWKGFRILASVLMSLLLLLGTVQAVAASGENGNNRTTGSLSLTLAVTENGEEVPLTNVPLALYQVADMDTEQVAYFHLMSSLSGTGVDLNNLKTAADAESAAKTLFNKVGAAGIVPLTGTTDADGKLFFDSLPKGVYLLVQTGAIDYCKVSPMLISVPYTEDGLNFEYDVQAFPKAEKTEGDKRGTLTVTKKLTAIDGEAIEFIDICAADATYYVRLFLDESATIPYGDVKAIHIQGQSSGSVDYTDLPAGTYYLRETDAQGNPYSLDDSFTDNTGEEVNCVIQVNGVDTSNITFDASADHFDNAEAVVDNIYADLPHGFYIRRHLNIEKKVLDEDGNEVTVDDTFYVTVNEVDPETGDETTVTTTELKQNDKVSVTFQVEKLESKEVIHTYRVFESDAEGNPVDKSTFGYTVEGEGNISFAGNETEKDITLTNTVITTTPKVTPEVTPGTTPGVTPGTTSGGHNNGSATAQKVKTGDNTPIIMWIVLLFAAAAAGGFAVRRSRRK